MDTVILYHQVVNHKIFIVKVFSDRMGNAKIKRSKIMLVINANVVRVVCPKII